MAYIRKIQRRRGVVYKVEISFSDYSKKSKSFRTREEAMAWSRSQEDLKLSEKNSGAVNVRMTMNEYFEKWFEEYARHHHSPGWQTTDLSMYRLHIMPVIGDSLIREVRATDIQNVLAKMREKGQAASSANRIRQLMSKMFTEATKTYRFIDFNPVSAVRSYKETQKQIEYLREDEAKVLMTWADRQPLGIAIHLALHLGLREGEIVGLKWNAINMSLKCVDIQRKWEKKTKVLEEFTKGRKIRTLGIPQQGLLDRLIKQRLKYPNSEFVVCDESEKMITPNALIAFLKKGVEDTQVRRITVHGLRHSFASLYMQKGGNLFDLQKLMGHSDAKTTERYRHSDPDYLRSRCKIVDLYSSSAQIPPKPEILENGYLRLVVN